MKSSPTSKSESYASKYRLLVGLIALAFLAGCAGNAPPTTDAPSPTSDAGSGSAATTAERDDLPPWHRDWEACPAIAEIPHDGDIFVLGDVHGDLERMKALLSGTGLINAKGKWKGRDAHLILVGDFTGKGNESRQVIAFLEKLSKEAARKKGSVVTTMGNHEAEFLAPNLTGPEPVWHRKVNHFIAEMENPENVYYRRGTPEEKELGEFLHCLPLAAKSRLWFFAHAGSTSGLTYSELKQKIVDEVDAVGYTSPTLLHPFSGLLNSRMSPPEKVWWQRRSDGPNKSKQRLKKWVSALGVRHMAVGHQSGTLHFNGKIKRPKGHMFQLFDGTLYLTDVGMSRGHDKKNKLSPGALLHIDRSTNPQTVTVLCCGGRAQELPPSGRFAGFFCPQTPN